ncbi:hypothetical protein M139_4910, partial [Bacteroides fragilis str. S23L24]
MGGEGRRQRAQTVEKWKIEKLKIENSKTMKTDIL